MPPILLASHFLAGSLLSLLMPVAVLIALLVWYVLAVRHIPTGKAERPRGAARVGEQQPGGGAHDSSSPNKP